jgi:hypothetical protein
VGGQYLRLQLDLTLIGTDSVCVVVPSLTQKVMVIVELTARTSTDRAAIRFNPAPGAFLSSRLSRPGRPGLRAPGLGS